MMSVRPEWLWKILDGQKTIEVRKTRPVLEPPFKVYLYCTKGGDELWHGDRNRQRTFGHGGSYRMNGTVCAEFVCDRIYQIVVRRGKGMILLDGCDEAPFTNDNKMCLTKPQLYDYLGSAKGYGFHITELRTYDAARSIGDFRYRWCIDRISRPPQSWFYVEER